MPIFGLHPAGLLETIFEEIGIAVAVVDREQNVIFANRTAVDLLGESADKPIAFRELRAKYRLQDSSGHEIAFDESAVMRAFQGERVEGQEMRAIFPNGTSKWLLAWVYPFSAMGMSGVIAFIVDETSEVELRRTVNQLQRLETLGAVAAGLTHNLNNLLETITLSAEAARRDDITRQEHQVQLNHIFTAALSAAGLIRRLMQFGRTQQMHSVPVHVNGLIVEVLHLVQPLLRQNVAVNMEFCHELPIIEADPSQLEQVLVNLIVNALDAMPNGGELTISTSIAALAPERSETPAAVSITVADTGIGIPEELRSAIFDPFFTTKPSGKGTGLGLSSVYGIVMQHKGTIRVDSAVGRGSAFVITLPLPCRDDFRTNAAD
jgi:two-component system, cell cycle sensor histidine kinase and response regulator CckA